MAAVEDILKRLKEGVTVGDEDSVKEAAHEVVATGMDPQVAIMDGLVAGMAVVGQLYEEQEYYVPELMVASEALYAGLDVLRPLVSGEASTKKGVAVIGAVQGDVHDIGKNLVKMMLEVNGFEVHDLGRDVELPKFADEALKVKADLVCMSALMTTTMIGIKDILPTLRERLPGVKILIGGAPISQKIADEWGADGYGESAMDAVRVAERLLGVA